VAGIKIKKQSKIDYFKSIWAPLILGCTVLLLMMTVRNLLDKKSETHGIPLSDYPPLEELNLVVQRVLESHSVSFRHDSQRNRWIVHVPNDFPIPSLHLALKEGVDQIQADIQSANIEPLSGRVSLAIGWEDSCYLHVQLSPSENVRREEGNIALLIDDFGGRWDSLIEEFINLGVNLSMSVIPGAKKSPKAVQALSQGGCEVILHLPMEPESAAFDDNGYLIRADMGDKKIRSIVQKALDQVGHVRGMNNHMGSRVTANRSQMIVLLDEMKRRGLYFIDSRTTAKTVAYDVARELGVPVARRDVFIDVENSKESIRRSLWELADKASRNGFSVGIGHARPLTLEVLKEEIPKIAARGYYFVHLSDVVR
jgi:polysaccharide deacetylase 2 family uncharacterized protein YibQ